LVDFIGDGIKEFGAACGAQLPILDECRFGGQGGAINFALCRLVKIVR
jgi:hypothetical protein